MQNQIQARPESKVEPQTAPVETNRIFSPVSSSIRDKAMQVMKSIASRPEENKPTELEIIAFCGCYKKCINSDFPEAMAQLAGFLDLIRDNPRLQTLAEAIEHMVMAEELLNLVVAQVDSI